MLVALFIVVVVDVSFTDAVDVDVAFTDAVVVNVAFTDAVVCLVFGGVVVVVNFDVVDDGADGADIGGVGIDVVLGWHADMSAGHIHRYSLKVGRHAASHLLLSHAAD